MRAVDGVRWILNGVERAVDVSCCVVTLATRNRK